MVLSAHYSFARICIANAAALRAAIVGSLEDAVALHVDRDRVAVLIAEELGEGRFAIGEDLLTSGDRRDEDLLEAVAAPALYLKTKM